MASRRTARLILSWPTRTMVRASARDPSFVSRLRARACSLTRHSPPGNTVAAAAVSQPPKRYGSSRFASDQVRPVQAPKSAAASAGHACQLQRAPRGDRPGRVRGPRRRTRVDEAWWTPGGDCVGDGVSLKTAETRQGRIGPTGESARACPRRCTAANQHNALDAIIRSRRPPRRADHYGREQAVGLTGGQLTVLPTGAIG